MELRTVKTSSVIYLTIVCLCALLVSERPAHAYLDPGTGSYSAQVLFAGLLVGAVSLRAFFRRLFDQIVGRFKNR